jgi:hypothetical protein
MTALINAVAQGTVGDDAPADQRDHSAREFREKKIVVDAEHRRCKVSGGVVIVWIGSSTSGTASSSSATNSSAGGDSDHDRLIFSSSSETATCVVGVRCMMVG